MRALIARLARTPLHPQWLLGRRVPPEALLRARGVIVDIGAATRWLERHLDADAMYVALDYPATASQLYRTRPDIFADACRLPLRDECADHVACLEVLEHVREPETALREIARILRVGGAAHVSMPFLYPIHDAPYDFQRWTEHGWRRSAEAAGLDVIELQGSQHALHAAAVIMCLAIAGPLQQRRSVGRLLLLPLAAIAVLVINTTAWMGALVWPDWQAIRINYDLLLVKREAR